MGKIREPVPVKLIVSLFAGDADLLLEAADVLSERFGPTDFRSQILPFDHTRYYEREFGPCLVRQILAFSELVAAELLPDVKHTTNDLELTWTKGGRRSVNLDPGYVALSKLVLATTKNYAHRIYMGKGIYAEVTLHYRDRAFHAWEWTYPDYASQQYLDIFGRIREIYVGQLASRADRGFGHNRADADSATDGESPPTKACLP